jgi:phosphate transport system permease protein
MTSNQDTTIKQRLRKDKWGRYVVTAFGGLVLLTLIILISHLLTQAFPLMVTPTVELQKRWSLPLGHHVELAGDVLSDQPIISTHTPCKLNFLGLVDNTLSSLHVYNKPCDHELAAASLMSENSIVDVSASGQVRVVPVRAISSLNGNANSVVRPSLSSAPLLQSSHLSFSLPSERWKSKTDWRVALSEKWVAITLFSDNSIFTRWVNRRSPTQIYDQVLSDVTDALALPGSGSLIVKQSDGIFVHPIGVEKPTPFRLTNDTNNHNVPLQTYLFSLEKDRTLFLHDNADNSLTRWVLSKKGGRLAFVPTYRVFLNIGERVLSVKEHASANAVAVLTNQKRLLLINRVSGDIVATYKLEADLNSVAWFGDRLYGYNVNDVYVWQVHNLSGITTWASLFSPQHYEGYDESDFVWQTTSASDFQEAKFSLTPLLIGSMKASLLALVIAIPVAIGAAIYTAYFAKRRLRHLLKPAVEMLEAIPSVLIGFIAAIWLSPKAEQFLFSFAFFLIVIPFILILVAWVQRPFAEKLPRRLRHGAELGFAIGGVLLLGYLSVQWIPDMLFSVFGTDGYALLAAESNSPIGKTTIVVAIALGVAIAPSIYSLAEDAINGVPNDLKHASFALGATRLQTLRYVVLHVAMPGVVAAIMLGFGRAFGETMIVLMVTGNTPIASWGLIEGLRALTANLAIELPEADVSSAHYQILFLTACILFAFTFVINTVAELLRQRLRYKAY